MTTSHPLDPLTPRRSRPSGASSSRLRSTTSSSAAGGSSRSSCGNPAKAALEATGSTGSNGASGPRDSPARPTSSCSTAADASRTRSSSTRRRAASLEWRHLEGVQPLAVVEELAEAEELVKRDPRFQAALAKRGVTDFDAVQVDAWPAGQLRRPERAGRPAGPLPRLHPPASRRQRVGAPGRRADRARRPDARSRCCGSTTTASSRSRPESGNFDVEAAIADAGALRDDIQPLEITQPEGPSFEVDGRVRAVAELGAARRLHAARGPGPEPGRLPRPGTPAADPPPRVALGDGRPLRRPEPDALLQERLRRGRERRRDRGLAAHPRLRLPRRDPLPRRDGRQRRRRAGRRSRTRSASTRRTSACSGATSSGDSGEGEVRRGAPAGDLVVLGDRQLRLRLLLVPAAGRHDRLRGEAHRGALDRRRARPASSPATASWSRPGSTRWSTSTTSTCGSTSTSTARELGGRGLDQVDAPRAGEPARQRVRGPARAAAHRGRGAPARRPGVGALVGDRQPEPRATGSGRPVGYRLVPGENARPFADLEAAGDEAGRVHRRAPLGDPLRAAASATPPASTRTSIPAAPGCRSGRRPTGRSSIGDLVVWYTFGHHHVPRAEDWPVMPVATIGFALQAGQLLRPQPGARRAAAGPRITNPNPPEEATERMSEIDGRVALITGASRGLGAAIARALDARGAKLALASRSGDDLGIDGAVAAPCDVRDLAQIEALVAAAVDRFGGLDIVVANAGVGGYGEFLDLDPEFAQEIIDVNVNGPPEHGPRDPAAALRERRRRARGGRLDRRPASPGGRGDLRDGEARAGRLHAVARPRALEPRRALHDDLPGRDGDRLRDGTRPHARTTPTWRTS